MWTRKLSPATPAVSVLVSGLADSNTNEITNNMKAISSLLGLSALIFAAATLSGLAQAQANSPANSTGTQSNEAVQPKPYKSRSGITIMKADRAAGFNGSFEYSKSGLPVNWAVYPSLVEKKGCELKFDTTDPKDGKQSLEFIIQQGADVSQRHFPGIFQERIILPERTYKTSFWIKNQGCRFKVELGTIKNEPHHHYTTVLNTAETMTNWTKFEFFSRAYEGETSFRFELRIYGPGTLWIDDVRVQEAGR